MSQILTTVVGSYPVPDWLSALPSEQAVLDATRVVLSVQEEAGIDVVADGELYRFDVNHPETNGMIEYFTRPMSGIRNEPTFQEVVAYRSRKGMGYRTRPPGVVEAAIGHGTLDLPAACSLARSLTVKPLKFTLTGPHMLAKTQIDLHYGNMPDLARAFAELLAEQVAQLDADVVQVDEANLPGSPDEWQWAADVMNLVLDAVSGKASVHLCFGNYGGQRVQSGSWSNLISYLNALHADHIVMETRRRPEEELEVFCELDERIGMGLGVIDVKTNVIETADEIAHSIERAVRLLGPGRIKYVHPDCGFWMLPRSVADGKIQALVAGRDLHEGR